MDQYTNSTSTDPTGSYDIRETYPLSKWLVLEAFDTRYYTTGISYRGENETTPDHQAGRPRRHRLPADHRPRRRDRLGRAALRHRHQRRHRRAPSPTTPPATSTTRPSPRPRTTSPASPDIDVNLYMSVPCPSGLTTVERANQCSRNRAIVPLQVDDPTATGDLGEEPRPATRRLRQGDQRSRRPGAAQHLPHRDVEAAARLHGVRCPNGNVLDRPARAAGVRRGRRPACASRPR